MEKFKKYFKIKHFGVITNQSPIRGKIAIQAIESGNFTNNQLEASIKAVKRIVKKKNFIVVRSTPFRFLTRKPKDVRMGRGKGNQAFKIYPVKVGSIIIEFKDNYPNLLRSIGASAFRLPFKLKLLKKN
jgi:large subunit ribosomal protein L16